MGVIYGNQSTNVLPSGMIISRIELLAEIDCSVRGMELMLHSVAENEAMLPPASNGIAEAMRDADDMIRIQTTFKDQTDQEQTGSETAISEQDEAKCMWLFTMFTNIPILIYLKKKHPHIRYVYACSRFNY